MSILPVFEDPIFPAEAVRVTVGLLPVTMMLAVEAVRSEPEVSKILSSVEVIVTAVAVVLAVVMAVEPRLTLRSEAARVTVPASVFTLVTFKCPVARVNEKLRPEVWILVKVSLPREPATE